MSVPIDTPSCTPSEEVQKWLHFHLDEIEMSVLVLVDVLRVVPSFAWVKETRAMQPNRRAQDVSHATGGGWVLLSRGVQVRLLTQRNT